MKLLLGSLLLAGVCWLGATLEFPTMSNFNNKRISGDWHPVANIVIEKHFPDYTLTAKWKGGVTYSYKYLSNGRCRTRRFQMAKQGVPGKFKTTSPTIVQILDTDYESYIISYIERGMDSFLTLATKQETMSPEMEKKLKHIASSAGVTGEVVPVVRAASC